LATVPISSSRFRTGRELACLRYCSAASPALSIQLNVIAVGLKTHLVFSINRAGG
jgi:hypothetical protein